MLNKKTWTISIRWCHGWPDVIESGLRMIGDGFRGPLYSSFTNLGFFLGLPIETDFPPLCRSYKTDNWARWPSEMARVPGAEREEQTDVKGGETIGHSRNKSIISRDSGERPFASGDQTIVSKLKSVEVPLGRDLFENPQFLTKWYIDRKQPISCKSWTWKFHFPHRAVETPHRSPHRSSIFYRADTTYYPALRFIVSSVVESSDHLFRRPSSRLWTRRHTVRFVTRLQLPCHLLVSHSFTNFAHSSSIIFACTQAIAERKKSKHTTLQRPLRPFRRMPRREWSSRSSCPRRSSTPRKKPLTG